MDRREPGKALKVPWVQRQQMGDVIYVHHSGQARIMNLYAGHAALHNDPAPLGVGGLRLGQK